MSRARSESLNRPCITARIGLASGTRVVVLLVDPAERPPPRICQRCGQQERESDKHNGGDHAAEDPRRSKADRQSPGDVRQKRRGAPHPAAELAQIEAIGIRRSHSFRIGTDSPVDKRGPCAGPLVGSWFQRSRSAVEPRAAGIWRVQYRRESRDDAGLESGRPAPNSTKSRGWRPAGSRRSRGCADDLRDRGASSSEVNCQGLGMPTADWRFPTLVAI